MELPQTSLIELPQDILEVIPHAVQIDSLATLAAVNRSFSSSIRDNAQLWHDVALELLGHSSCALHEVAHSKRCRTNIIDNGEAPRVRCAAKWWRDLTREATLGRTLRWNSDIPMEILAKPEAQSLLQCCAHTSVTIGELVLLIGGSTPNYVRHPAFPVVVNCRTLEVQTASLSADSLMPPTLLHHAACEIAPAMHNGPPRVLVVGGVVRDHDMGEPVFMSANEGLVLELLETSPVPLVRWKVQKFKGDLMPWYQDMEPPKLFHHILCSFNKGNSVVTWGGDTTDFFNHDGLAKAQVRCSTRASVVFVLDVHTWRWQNFDTGGECPGHRSLAHGVVYDEQLVVIGGTSDPVPPRGFELGELASMSPYSLDLHTWTWRKGTSITSRLPAPRTRCAAERRGKWLFGFGGRGEENQALDDVFQLNLKSLEWVQPDIIGSENKDGHDACLSSMAGGLVLGGLASGVWHAKADALLFAH